MLGCFEFPTQAVSILGPVLFLFYMNDIFTMVDNHHIQFILCADNTACLFSTQNYELASLTKENVNKIHQWFQSNELMLNINKTEFSILAKRPDTQNCIIVFQANSLSIDRVPYFKLVGEIMSQNSPNLIRTISILIKLFSVICGVFSSSPAE